MLTIYPQNPGTYCFLNKVNNKVYIGSAQCLYNRINNHLNGKQSNLLLQRAIKKYGLISFNIIYVITESHAEAKMQEQLMLDYLFQNNVPKYNISAYAYGGDGSNAKVRYALEVNNPSIIYTFKSSIEAAAFTKGSTGHIASSCKNAKPLNGSGRWLFSDVSIDDLKAKFNKLTQAKIKGINNYSNGFILINKITKKQSQVFYTIYEPQKQGYNINPGNLSQCLLGNLRTVNGYYVTPCI
jgi:group I intron endonuclease